MRYCESIILQDIILILLPTLLIWSFKLTYLTTKYCQQVSFFSSNLFSSHTLAWTCVLHLTDYSYYFFLLYLSHFLTQFNTTCTITVYPCMLYKLSITIFRLILSLKVTLECLLYSRVKHSITSISVVICSPNLRAQLLVCSAQISVTLRSRQYEDYSRACY